MKIDYLVLAVFVFIIIYATFVPDEGISIAGISVDALRSILIEFLERGDNKRKLEILGTGSEQILKQGFILGLLVGILFCLLFIIKLKALSFVFIFLGGGAGLLISDIAIKQQFKNWQASMQEGIPILTDFAPSFLQVAGMTVRGALENTVSFLTEPFKTEFSNAVDEIRRNGNALEVFEKFARRVKDPIITAICVRLSMSYETHITPELFTDLREDIENAREKAAARLTDQLNVLHTLVVTFGLVGVFLLAIFPAGKWIFSVLKSTFGGG